MLVHLAGEPHLGIGEQPHGGELCICRERCRLCYLGVVHGRSDLGPLPGAPPLVVHVEEGVDHKEQVPAVMRRYLDNHDLHGGDGAEVDHHAEDTTKLLRVEDGRQ